MEARHSTLQVIEEAWREKGVSPFSALEDFFLNPAPITWDELYEYEHARKLYKEALNETAQQLKAKSLQLFLALEVSDLIENSSLKSQAIAERFQNIILFLFQAIIIQDRPSKSILAFERFTYLLSACIAERDFMTAFALHSALDSPTLNIIRTSELLNEQALIILKDADNLFEFRKGQANLRAAMVGRCVPYIGPFKRCMQFLDEVTDPNKKEDPQKIARPFLVAKQLMAYENVEATDPINMEEYLNRFSWECRFQSDNLPTHTLKRAAKLISLAGKNKHQVDYATICELWTYFAKSSYAKLQESFKKPSTPLALAQMLITKNKPLVHRNVFLTRYRECLARIEARAENEPKLYALYNDLIGLPIIADKIMKLNSYAWSDPLKEELKKILLEEQSKELTMVKLSEEQRHAIREVFKKLNISPRLPSDRERRTSVFFRPLNFDQLQKLEERRHSPHTASSRSDTSCESLSVRSQGSARNDEGSQQSAKSQPLGRISAETRFSSIMPRLRGNSILEKNKDRVEQEKACTALEYLSETHVRPK